jgi:uncharacterized protein YukE
MPNWCSNTVTITADKEKIDDLEKFLEKNEGKDWFSFVRPCPQELIDVGSVSIHTTNEELVAKYGYSDWYTWGIDNWGCKWNCDANDWHRESEDSISFSFESPWGPPTELYEFMQENDYNVTAHYCEEGMGFVGMFDEGCDRNYEYSDLESLEDIPEEIVEHWDLQSRIEEQEEWNEDEEEESEEVSEVSEAEIHEKLDQMIEDFKKNQGSSEWPGTVDTNQDPNMGEYAETMKELQQAIEHVKNAEASTEEDIKNPLKKD